MIRAQRRTRRSSQARGSIHAVDSDSRALASITALGKHAAPNCDVACYRRVLCRDATVTFVFKTP